MDAEHRRLHHSLSGEGEVEALIELLCLKHAEPDPVGPLITLVDGVWAYCAGHGSGDHSWTRIEATRREQIGDVTAPEVGAS